MIPALSIAASGMHAATVELDAAAENIANAQTEGGVPGTPGGTIQPVYQPVRVTLSDAARNGTPGGVTAQATRSADYSLAYDPTAPFANAAGYVATPNVDVATQLVDALYAKVQFSANARVVRAASQMEKTAIDMLA